MKELLDTLPQVGQLEWIGLRPEKRASLQSVDAVEVTIEMGLEGDHYQGKSRKRQITLIQAEHLEAVASMLAKSQIPPEEVRRNLVIRGINLLALKDKQFRIGEEVVLEMTGLCHPCSRMEQNLGTGGYNAMRGHGGITARVINGGKIHLGDSVQIFSSSTN